MVFNRLVSTGRDVVSHIVLSFATDCAFVQTKRIRLEALINSERIFCAPFFSVEAAPCPSGALNFLNGIYKFKFRWEFSAATHRALYFYADNARPMRRGNSDGALSEE